MPGEIDQPSHDEHDNARHEQPSGRPSDVTASLANLG
jgi:hypothetical protein